MALLIRWGLIIVLPCMLDNQLNYVNLAHENTGSVRDLPLYQICIFLTLLYCYKGEKGISALEVGVVDLYLNFMSKNICKHKIQTIIPRRSLFISIVCQFMSILCQNAPANCNKGLNPLWTKIAILGGTGLIWVNFPRTGKMVKMWHFFCSSAVTKRFDLFNFSQLFWRDFARCILKMFSFWS